VPEKCNYFFITNLSNMVSIRLTVCKTKLL
jgi:hypothetical protein